MKAVLRLRSLIVFLLLGVGLGNAATAQTAEQAIAQPAMEQQVTPPAQAPGTSTDAPLAEQPVQTASRVVRGVPSEPGFAPWMVQLFSTTTWTCGQVVDFFGGKQFHRFGARAMQTGASKCFSGNLEAGHQLSQDEGYPFMHVCGGTLIAPEWILTAAHCFDGYKPEEIASGLKFRAGTQNISKPGMVLDIAAVVINKDYAGDKDTGDIALVRIANPQSTAGNRNIRPIKIAEPARDPTRSAGNTVTLTGWGSTVGYDLAALRTSNQPPEFYPPVLQQVDLSVSDRAQCGAKAATEELRSWFMKHTLKTTAFCAQGKETADRQATGSCQGDSGSPLVARAGDGTPNNALQTGGRFVLVGLVSGGPGCAVPNASYKYTQVSQFLKWIDLVRRNPKIAGLVFM